MKKLYEILQPPFKYDDYGQKVFDKNNNLVVDIRAWGCLQYSENPEKLQGKLGNDIAMLLSGFADIELRTQEM